ncbi:hypothetical protein DQ04_09141040 [Trypanosoma grayi]|uniref:hypothetical protein n=1 Tax=Trypanosoma grayi TaxID=71804 RepID=UPI0004F49C87|nr:hypothetical protein DQ04_09141040 [Trypanosoma grayi]KEG07670.1 hypothetical protein DQ04_09141040 [Trypanosoma grayi]
MMAAVGRPALFVVAVALCCMGGCAAAPAESGSKQRRGVLVELEDARKKAVDAQNAVNDAMNAVVEIKQATDNFKTAADKASKAATELNKKVKEKDNGELKDTANVATLANDALTATKKSHESVGLLCKKTTEAVEATTRAGTLFTEAEGMAGGASDNVGKVATKEAKRAPDVIVKLSEVLTALKQAQKCSEEAKKAATTEGNAFYAMNSADEGLGFLKEITAPKPLSVTKELKDATEKIADLTKAAVKGADGALAAVKEVSGHADKAVKSAESLLKDIDVALQALKTRENESEVSPSDADSPPPSPSEPSQDEAQGQSLQQEPLSSSSTGEKPSDQQEAGTAAADTEKSPSVPSEEKTAAESLENAASQAADAPLIPPNINVHNTLSDARRVDSSVSPPWVRTPLLLVAGVLGLLAVC